MYIAVFCCGEESSTLKTQKHLVMRNEILERVISLLSQLGHKQLEAVESYIKDAILPAGGEENPATSSTPQAGRSDGMIEVDRSQKPKYPTWMRGLKNPELEAQGPSRYRLSDLEWFKHPGQAHGKGESLQVVYDFLVKHNMLERCLTLLDGEAIKKISIEEYKKLSRGQDLFLWGTSYIHTDTQSDVAYLTEENGRVHIRWKNFKVKVDGNSVCLMHPDKKGE